MPQPDTGRTQHAHADAKVVRRRAAVVFAAFIVLSAVVHFTSGQMIAVLAPRWQYPGLPEQALTIISFSRVAREHVATKPTPTPTPTPIIVKRTHMNVTAMRFLELGGNHITARHIRPFARRHADLIVNGPETPKPAVADAPLAAAAPPTSSPRDARTSASADTGGANDRLAGSIVWGDDNPPHVISQSALTGASFSRPVKIKVEVGPDGNVSSVSVDQSSGDATLDDAALDAARKSTYAPATLNGLPVHGTCIVEFPPRITGST